VLCTDTTLAAVQQSCYDDRNVLNADFTNKTVIRSVIIIALAAHPNNVQIKNN